MKLSWEVDGVDVTVGKLEDGIEAGMERAVDDILEILEREAKDTIRVNDRIFNKVLLKSFTDQTGNADIESGHQSRFLNTARYAGAVEHGVHSSKYADGGPPISALMPWVLANLQDWTLEDNDGGDAPTGGNTLKQSAYEEASQTADNAINWTNTTKRGFIRLRNTEREKLESTLKSSNLDDLSTDEMYNQMKAWKVDSDPYKTRTDTERVVQYGSDLKETFGVDGDVRGTDLYTPEITFEETKDALKTYNEISKIFAYNHLDEGDGTFTAHRYSGRTEIGRLGKKIWENPDDSEWGIDQNIVNNYSTKASRISLFDNGVLHSPTVNIEDDLLMVVDHLADTRNNGEAELHLRGGRDYKYGVEDLTFVADDGTKISADEIITSDFANGNFGAMSRNEVLGLANVVKRMAEKDVKLDTQASRDNLNAWLDRFLDDGIYEYTDTEDYKWEQYVDKITS